ncbi:PHB depolymerase family esterase [Rhizobium sp. TRM95111]|uniref:extracellular catalytic domain type 1 short-chain-length polyhydroxyalkanoate depolymerase n=1 Tax=Rhizobium alarense TaxID=2846851 RepID=UPI001F3CEF78|nr:PHB depolymerase family esterase [Rhizobium alarense]MCF3642738.1 PHB depolymerase family esterase [Rhizobium alarense]
MRDRFKRSAERLLPSQERLGELFWPFARAPEIKAPPVRRRSVRTPELAGVEEFGSNPGGLLMFEHVPEGLPAGRPLVLVLHGCRQSAQSYDRAAGWASLAEERGFSVVYAQQREANNQRLCFTWYRPSEVTRDRGELMSIRQMVDSAVLRASSDPARLFVTGLSAGGAMTAAMLANYPELFAGGAVIAGLPFGAARDANRAFEAMASAPERTAREWGSLVRKVSPRIRRRPQISVWHGTADATVALSNAAAIVEQWRDVYRLPADAFVEKRMKDRRIRIWPDGEGRPLIVYNEIDGLGHGTPVLEGEGGGYAASAEPFMLEAGFSSTIEIAKSWGLTRKWRR